jgi:peptide/nickel transport system substrate-binding protein
MTSTSRRERPGSVVSVGPRVVSRRFALRLLGSGAGLLAVTACGPGTPAPPTATQAPAATSAPATVVPPAATVVSGNPTATSAPPAAATTPQPIRGGTLRIGTVGDLVSLDGHLHSGNTSIWFVYDRLSAYDEKLQPQPMLAESWDISSDYKQIKLNLRRGVQFHSGRELTSDDVKYNILRVANPKTGAGQMQPLAAWWSGIDLPDKYTAVLTSDQPRPTTFDLFEYLNILDRDTMEGPDAKTKAVGTGPFTFVEWAQGDHLALGKNANYWQSGRPYLDGLAIGILRDQQAQVAQLEGGALGIITNPPLRDYVRLKADSKYTGIAHTGTGGFYLIGANTTMPPLDNKTVRQALNYAIDRKRFTDTILLGVSDPESLPWRPGSAAYDDAKNSLYAFDRDKAKSMLDGAGVSNLELDILLYLNSAEYVGMAEIYQSDLAQIGVKLNIKTQDVGTWLDQVNNRKYRGLYSGPGAYAHLSPSTCFNSGKASNPIDNNSGYKSDQYTQLINMSASETDPSKQKALYSQLNDLFLDESFVMTIAPVLPIQVAHANVHGMLFSRHEDIMHTDTWFEH